MASVDISLNFLRAQANEHVHKHFSKVHATILARTLSLLVICALNTNGITGMHFPLNVVVVFFWCLLFLFGF